MIPTGMKSLIAGAMLVTGLTATAFAQSPEKTSVKVGLAAQTPAFLGLYLADAEGLYDGLDVELVAFRSGSDLARAVVSGAVDVAAGALIEALVPIQQGQPYKVFWGGMNNSVMDWYAIPSISSIADSKGARYGISSYGSLTDFVTRYALEKNGLNPETDVQIIPGGSSSARLAAMEAGQLDVNLLIPPAKFVAAEKGYNKILSQSDIAPDYPYEVLYASESFIAENPNTVAALIDGIAKGVELAKSDGDRAIKEIEARTGVETKYATLAYDEIVKQLYADGRLPTEAGMKAFWDVTIMSGEFAEVLPTSEWLDPTFIDEHATAQ
ncbi:ABC transporter substrate-binding protein [Acuticoccus mangrovi]|uniref:ABC transporter substrate-binding protein n=1 Tax=Acuticoccus mangrovi TaxID=2796142 RepID=A0A934INC8_9HYPH|nr:ABC transporter substrate-binding protein [Acuticoccus mangrovi]MBJ3775553.1 ABC transporter substrate-binding protein [Acuticoccus mangrovi]